MRQNKEKYRLVAVFVTAALLLAAIFVSAQMGSADVSVLSLLRQRMSGVYEAVSYTHLTLPTNSRV